MYFFNTLTNESSWTKPEGFKGEEDEGKQAKPVSSTRVRGTRWSRVECEDGKIYYYNVDTKVGRRQRLLLPPTLQAAHWSESPAVLLHPASGVYHLRVAPTHASGELLCSSLAVSRALPGR